MEVTLHLVAWGSHCHGFSCCGLSADQCTQSSVVAACRLSCSVSCGISVHQPGIKPKSPALQGGFLTTGLPGKSLKLSFWDIQPTTHWCVYARSLQLCLTLCNPVTVAHQTPLSKGFSRQEYWSGMPCLLPNPGIEPASPAPPALQADSLPLSHCGSPTTHWFSSVHFSCSVVSDSL